MTAPKSGVKVRMYRTGLGDCFLLALPKTPTAADKRNVFYLMIDCGVYKATPTERNSKWIRQIAEHIRDSTGGHLNLLVITHEHWDHVSGFHKSQARAIFEQFTLDTLWMAWTEDMTLPLAADLHQGRKAARHALAYALTKMKGLGLTAEKSETTALVGKVLDFFGDLEEDPDPAPASGSGPPAVSPGKQKRVQTEKSVQTEETMRWLRDVYGKGKTEYLHPGDGPLTFDGVRDVRIYVLGPPEDSELIERHEPTGEEVYSKAMAAAVRASFFAAFGVVPNRLDALPDSDDVREARRMSLPFEEVFQIKSDDAVAPFFYDHYLNAEPWRRIDGDWLDAAGGFALQLDKATNNTSLAFALEIGPPGKGKVLLFPGDAQVGNLRSWFGKVKIAHQELGKDMGWQIGRKNVTAEDLLRRTVLYKVGHHGSHNATLRAQGLELMSHPDLVAFLPVDEHIAREKADYGEMPLRSLVKELAIRTRGRVARNDEGAVPKDRLSTLAPIPGAPALTSEFLDEKTELYFEYTVSPPR